jgi:hypothetical protein
VFDCPHNIHLLIPGIYEYVSLHGKMDFTDVRICTDVKDLETGRLS